MLIADDKMDARDLMTRQSTCSVGSEAMFAPSCGNCMEVLHDLYQKLEPQISKSYRPNVKYVPGKDPGPRYINMAINEKLMDDKARKQKQIKTAKMVIGAVAEMQKRRDSNVSVKKKFSDIARRASVQEIGDSMTKEVSQSLPDLTETAES